MVRCGFYGVVGYGSVWFGGVGYGFYGEVGLGVVGLGGVGYSLVSLVWCGGV